VTDNGNGNGAAPQQRVRGPDKKKRKRGSGRKSTIPFIPDPTRELWDRQPGETDKSWEAFQIYREMHADRTIEDTARALNRKAATHILEWSRRNSWRVRVEAYDRYLDRQAREASERMRVEQAKKDTREQLLVAKSMWVVAAKALESLNATLDYHRKQVMMARELEQEPPPSPLSASDTCRLAEIGMKLARLIEDKPTEITDGPDVNVNVTHNHLTVDDLRRLTTDELEALKPIAKKLYQPEEVIDAER